MDVTYNRLKKQVETRHGEATFEKFGDIIVTCMEFVEHGVEDLKKAQWYLKQLIELKQVEEEEDSPND